MNRYVIAATVIIWGVLIIMWIVILIKAKLNK